MKTLDRLEKRKAADVVVLEGRPGLEASRFSCEQLLKRKISPTLISDNMAGSLFYNDLVKEVWLSCQISDKTGALCDVGALVLAVLGKYHKVPVLLVPGVKRNKFIGKPKDLLTFQKKRIAPSGIKAYVPLAEWVPKKYITRILK